MPDDPVDGGTFRIQSKATGKQLADRPVKSRHIAVTRMAGESRSWHSSESQEKPLRRSGRSE
jgi:hypothetical protein